jgi:hypothetical protein
MVGAAGWICTRGGPETYGTAAPTAGTSKAKVATRLIGTAVWRNSNPQTFARAGSGDRQVVRGQGNRWSVRRARELRAAL